MTSKLTPSTGDVWSQWLLNRRHGGDAQFQPAILASVDRYRQRVLDAARLAPGMTLLDVGTGTGLIAFGAIERVGPSLRVVLTDISEPLLQHVQSLARQRGVQSQCSFIQGTADKLAGVADASIDVVTTRAVLAYVPDKPAAFREFFRVLKPGRRISLCEPVLQDDALENAALGRFIAAQPSHPDIGILLLRHRWKSAQLPATEKGISQYPLTNYSERDLVQMARQAGFAGIHLELHIDQLPATHHDWDCFLNSSLHPWAPTVRGIITERFTSVERGYFEQVMRPQVESGRSVVTEVVAYLAAERPTA